MEPLRLQMATRPSFRSSGTLQSFTCEPDSTAVSLKTEPLVWERKPPWRTAGMRPDPKDQGFRTWVPNLRLHTCSPDHRKADARGRAWWALQPEGFSLATVLQPAGRRCWPTLRKTWEQEGHSTQSYFLKNISVSTETRVQCLVSFPVGPSVKCAS